MGRTFALAQQLISNTAEGTLPEQMRRVEAAIVTKTRADGYAEELGFEKDESRRS